MRATWGKGLFAGAMLLIALGVAARWHALVLEVQADQLAARSRDASSAFTNSLRTADDDAEFKLLDQRRDRTMRASAWARSGLFSLGAAVLLLLGAWLSHELRLFRELAVEVETSQDQARATTRPPPGSEGGKGPGDAAG